MSCNDKKLNRLPKYYKEHVTDDILELAENGKKLYDYVSNKEFEWDVYKTDRLLWDIRHLINRIDI